MKDRKKYFLKDAVVLLIALAMVLSVIPHVASDTSSIVLNKNEAFALQSDDPTVIYKGLTMTEININTGSLGGSGAFADSWIKYHDGTLENSLGLTSGGSITMAIELTQAELAGFSGYDICEVDMAHGSDSSGGYAGVSYELWILDALPASSEDIYSLPAEDIYATGTTTSSVWDLVDVIDYPVPSTGSVFIGFNFVDTAAGQYPCGMDETTTTPDRGGIVTYAGYGSWGFLGAIGFPAVWGISVGVCEGGGPGPGPVEDCIPNACDFAIDGFTDEFLGMSSPIDIDGDGTIDYYMWNSLPKDICIKIANKGEIGIGELKLLADIYKKVCGPTITIFDDPKYDLTKFPCCGDNYPFVFPDDVAPEDQWWVEDDDQDSTDPECTKDSWTLQGGADNRWLTNNQAWRCTRGEDRSYGADEDVYLGLSDCAPAKKYDNLTTPMFDISNVACADFTFSHWCEGEYIIDEDGYITLADYGTIAYSLDNGVTWTEIPQNEFVAYDTDDEWVQVNLKFINTAIDEGDPAYKHAYNIICDDCEPEDGDIVIEDNLTGAQLRVRFIWHKDPCLQFEGWYIDDLSVSVTLDYELELVHQTHEILELDPCDPEVGVVWEDYCFPIGFDPEDDTWYEIHIYGQVFDPMGCEIDLFNNEFKYQFKIKDIHDVACVEIVATGDTDTQPGEAVPFNVTVQNVGTYAEDNVPVSLKVGDLIKYKLVNDDFEANSLGDYSIYYFLFDECDSETLWRWSKGDTSLDKIYENEPAQARSRNPGSECLVFAKEGNYPYMIEDSMSVIAPSQTLNLDPNKNWGSTGPCDDGDPLGAELSFDMKYSLDVVDSALGSYAMLGVMPAEGPASGYVLFIDNLIDLSLGTYSNDWVHFEEKDVAGMLWNRILQWNSNNPTATYDYIPECELGILVWGEGDCVDIFTNTGGDGGCINPDNPVPWTGFMFDEFYLDIKSVDDNSLTEFAKLYTGELQPGQTETLSAAWTSTACAHGITAETQLASDVNPSNDKCCVIETLTTEEEHCFEFKVEDLTGGGDCLWHVCCNRQIGDDCYAWAGRETAQSAQYVNNMDDWLVSPSFDISDYADEGVVINFKTYYQFDLVTNDFGEFYIWRDNTWDLLRTFMGSSNGQFVDIEYFIPEGMVPDVSTKLGFRMHSDGAGVDDGWYLDDITIYNVTDDNNTATFADGDQLYYHAPYDGGSAATATVDPSYPIDYMVADYFYDVDAPIGYACPIGFPATFPWAYADPTGGMTFNVYFYDELPPDDPDWGNPVYAFEGIDLTAGDMVNLGPFWGGAYQAWKFICPLDTPVDMEEGYVAWQSVQPDSDGSIWFLSLNSHDDDMTAWQASNGATYGALAYDLAFELLEGAGGGGGGELPDGAVVGDPIPIFPWTNTDYTEDWERGYIEPWICEAGFGGQYWIHSTDPATIPSGAEPLEDTVPCDAGWYTIPSQNLISTGYGKYGTGLNDAIAFKLDLTDPTLDPNYIIFGASMNYNLSKERIYIEFSPDWDGVSDMETATWVEYWAHTPGDNYGDNTEGWTTLEELTSFEPYGADRWNIDEYSGDVVWVRFRLETNGNGAGINEGWAIDNLHLKVKYLDITFEDKEAPQTSLFFNDATAKVTLVAVDYPLGKGVGVDATYYKIDGGETKTYGGPFTITEGKHTVEYWSVDNNGNTESRKTAQVTVDTTPPVVEITSPEAGKIYLFGSPIMNRIFGENTLCFGKVPIAATATDNTGISAVLFGVNGATHWDDEAPYEYTFNEMHFGKLTISVSAIDLKGLRSDPVEMEITVYSLGLF